MVDFTKNPINTRQPIVPSMGIPSNSIGQDGEVCKDLLTGAHYFKANGVWLTIYTPNPGRMYTGAPYIGLVATRSKAPTNGNSGVKSHMSRTVVEARDNITQVGAAFANWYVSTSNAGENVGGGNCTITASIEYPLGGNIYRLTFGGQASGTCYDYSTLESDLVAVSIPQGAQFAVREYRIYSGNGAVVYSGNTGIGPNNSFGDCYNYTSVTDLTGVAGTFSTNGNTTLYSPPVAVYGPTVNPSYAIIGDSRSEGYNDDATQKYVGNLARSIGPNRAYTNLAAYGETAAVVAGTKFNQRMRLANQYCSHVFSDYGINDIVNSSVTADTLLSSIQQIRSKFPNLFFFQNTLEPNVTTTDSGATLTNQTVNANDAARVWFNNFIRSGGLFDGFGDPAKIVESAINSGKWNAPGWTTDGVHETSVGYAAVASGAVIPVA